MWALVFCILFFHMICVVYFLWETFALYKQRKKDGFLCFPLSFFGGKKAPSLPFSFFPPISLTFGKYCTRQVSHFTYVEKSSSPLPLRLRQSSMQNFIKFFPVFPCLLFFTGKRVTRTAQPVWEGTERSNCRGRDLNQR